MMRRVAAVVLGAMLVASGSVASAQDVITGVPADSRDVQIGPAAKGTGDDGTSVSEQSAAGRVTIVDNSNRLNMVAEKPQFDMVTEAKRAAENLKADMEEHQKKMDSLAREEAAEQNGKAEEGQKIRAQAMKISHDNTLSAEAKAKTGHEELQKKTAKDNAAEADQKRDEQEKALAAAQKEAMAEADGKSAAHAKQKAALKDGSWQKGEGTQVVAADRNVALAAFNNYGSGWETAQSRVTGNVCVVRGLVRGPAGNHIGTLDENCRPTGGRLIFNQMVGGWDARVDVLPDGRVFHITSGNPQDYLSLSGITFDINPSPRVSLYSGWNNYGSGYRGVTQSRLDSLCVISGLIQGGSWGLIGGLPGECVPHERLIFSCNNHGSPTRVDVLSNGQFHYAGGSHNHGWVSLDGIVYTPYGGGNDLPLYSGWGNYWSGYRPARWQRTGPVCAISGLIRGSWGSHITTLPGPCRPRERLIFNANVHEYSARVDITPDGGVYFISHHGRHGWLSLSNIHFVVARDN